MFDHIMADSADQTARFRTLALPVLGYLHRLALALTMNRSRADDLVQETYLRALRYFASYQGDDFKPSALTAERAQALRGLLAKLPENLREVLILREYGDLSYSQIAATLSIPVGTVMSRLSRARDDLRKAWLAAHEGGVT
jgi:RNA polymerase sigma-70 factor (ECF subfamily)